MSWTKRQFVEAAFEEVGYAAYSFDLQSEQLTTGLKRLDAMMATWNNKGIRIGYPLVSDPASSSLDTATDVPDSANEAIYTNLAIKIAPVIGKTVSRETKRNAKSSLNALFAQSAKPNAMQMPTNMPAGAGNKKWSYDQPYVTPPEDDLEAGPDATIDFY